MIITDKRYENMKVYGLAELGDIFIYNDIENKRKYCCIQSGFGAIDLKTGEYIEISPFEKIETVNTELIINRK